MTEYSLGHSRSLRTKHPQYYPIILIGDTTLLKTKLLINKDMTVSQLMSYIRTNNKLSKREAYFLFTKRNVLLMQSSTITDIYINNSSDNGFLYVIVKKENTFG